MLGIVKDLFTRNEGMGFMKDTWASDYRELFDDDRLVIPARSDRPFTKTDPTLCASIVVDRVKRGWYNDKASPNTALADDADTVVNNAHAYVLAMEEDNSDDDIQEDIDEFKQRLKGMRITIRTRIRNAKVAPHPRAEDADDTSTGSPAAADPVASHAGPASAPASAEDTHAALLQELDDGQRVIAAKAAALQTAEAMREEAAKRLEELGAVDTSGINAHKVKVEELTASIHELTRQRDAERSALAIKEKNADAKLKAAEVHFRAASEIEVTTQELEALRDKSAKVKEALGVCKTLMTMVRDIISRKHRRDGDDDNNGGSAGHSDPGGKKRRVEENQ